MTAPAADTRSTRLRGRGVGLAVVVTLTALAAVGFGLTCRPSRRTGDPTKPGDLAMYRQVVERVRAGEPYYAVAGSELRARGYASRPFLNWRLPTLAYVLAVFPSPAGPRLILGVLAAFTACLWARVLVAQWGLLTGMVGGGLVVGGLLVVIVEPLVFFHEAWSGVLVAGSLALYGMGRTGAAVCVGFCALLFRELAAPYAAAMCLAAALERRTREFIAWAGVVAAFCCLLAAHAAIVNSRMTSDALTNAWVVFGGWCFVLSTAEWIAIPVGIAQANGSAVAALLVPLSLAGLVIWPGRFGTRLASVLGAYVAFFLVAGRPDNFYWGLMYSPLLLLGLVPLPQGAKDAWTSVATSRGSGLP